MPYNADVIKYFGFELGAQTNIDPSDDRWIINGAHEASKLQDYLDGFISKFVLCKKCKNPETDVQIKDGNIMLDCKACGQRSSVDLRLKLSGFIIKHAPKKGKKDKSTKKAERKAKKEAQAKNGENGENGGSDEGSPDNGSNNDDDDDAGEVELEAGSDDELTRRINAEAKDLKDQDEKEVEWTVDVSEAAMKARAKQLPDDLKKQLALDDEEEGEGEDNPYSQLGAWIEAQAKAQGGVAKIDDVEVYKKASELGIEKKHRTLAVLVQTLFDENIVKQIEPHVPMLKKMITSDKHEKALLGGTERFIGITKPELVSQLPKILMAYYENDLASEETIKSWGTKASKKYVDISTSRKVRKAAEPFITWLENAESDEDDSESE